MTEQQWTVIADRAVIGDKVDFETWDAGDRLVYQYPGHGNHPGELVRIERLVPPADLPALMHLTEAEADLFHSAMQEPGQPTRDEVADDLIEKLPPEVSHALNDDQLDAVADAVRGMLTPIRRPTREQIAEALNGKLQGYFSNDWTYERILSEVDEAADAVLALIQNGAHR